MAATESVASLECWDAGSIPSLAQWVKDVVLPQLQLRSQLQLGSDPWSRNFICCGAAKKKNKKKKKKEQLSPESWKTEGSSGDEQDETYSTAPWKSHRNGELQFRTTLTRVVTHPKMA